MTDHPSEHWRGRAKELRNYAQSMQDPELRREVELIAERYERLADNVAQRETAKKGERKRRRTVKLAMHRR
jgi:hypothetical protein